MREGEAVTTEQLTGRELDAEVGRKLFDLKIFRPSEVKGANGECFDMDDYYYIPSKKPPRTHMIDARPVPAFSSDMYAAHLMEERIKELGLAEKYAEALKHVLNLDTSLSMGCYLVDRVDVFAIAHASAAERARAAMRVLEEKC